LKDELSLLKEYVAFKIVQLVLYCKEPEPVTIKELYLLYKEDQELKEDILDELLFPLQKFVLATYISKTLRNGEKKMNVKILEALLDAERDIPSYLDSLVKDVGLGESFEKIIEESLEELLNKPADIVSFISEILEYDTSTLTIPEPKTVKMRPKMIELPKNYLDFTSVYLKKKCSNCNEYSKHMFTVICLICGDVMCLAYCPTHQKRGNLNSHAKQYHLGVSLFLQIQKSSKSVVGYLKNSIYSGKDVYVDKLGHSIHSLMNDPRCRLYSLQFEKFELNEDFVKEAQEIIEQNNMAKEIYKITTTSGHYYAEGSL